VVPADRAAALRAEPLEPPFERLKALHTPKRPPRPGDWLAEHHEDGQSFAELARSLPLVPTAARRTIYLQPIGDFSDAQRRVVARAADYVERFFGLPVRAREAVLLDAIPALARRRHPAWRNEQLRTTYLLHLLRARRPDDALAVLGLTAQDLYPADDWNFVFGQALPGERVGVWSLYRNGDPSASPTEFRLCLRRTLTTAVHELAHLFGIAHCIAWECVMNGSNNSAEKDARPLWLCPTDSQKLCLATERDPGTQFERLAEFAAANGFVDEAARFERAREVVSGAK
jgi:archaemetzincin